MHYYLKTEHQFTPEEADALLQFQDPLDVARWCKEDNPYEHSFPICKLLKSIDAYDHFDLEPDSKTLANLTKQFNAVLTRNMYTFRENMVALPANALYDHANSIIAVTETYAELMNNYEPTVRDLEVLLQYDNPLWIVSQFGPHEDIKLTMDIVYSSGSQLKNMDHTLPWEKASVRDRLEQAKHEAKGKPTKVTPHPKKESR